MSSNIIIAGQSSGNLNFRAAQKMIHRFLTCERIKTDLDDGIIKGLGSSGEPEIRLAAFTKQELAEKLGISQEELENLESPNFYGHIANKITLPLIHLYCSTKFIDGEYKGE